MAFPQDFEIPQDQGGPGQGQSIGGFGGHPSRTRDQHRSTLQGVGKAPVILLHGNSGSADSGRWNMLDLQQMLIKAAYPRELIWAPSYLGTGTLDLMTPHQQRQRSSRVYRQRLPISGCGCCRHNCPFTRLFVGLCDLSRSEKTNGSHRVR